MKRVPKDYLAKLRAKISKWNIEDDRQRARVHEIKVDGLVQYRRHLGELKAKRQGAPTETAKIRDANAQSSKEEKTGIEIVQQALIESIKASKSCSSQLVTLFAR